MKRFWIINFLLFQLSWFSAAFFTRYATILIVLLLVLHFILSPCAKNDFKILWLALIGIAVDVLHLSLGTFTNGEVGGGFPIWLAVLWVMFSISFNHSLHWLVNKPIWILAVIGLVGGTTSYWAGIEAGALQSNLSRNQILLTLASSWGVLFPLLALSYRYLTTKVERE